MLLREIPRCSAQSQGSLLLFQVPGVPIKIGQHLSPCNFIVGFWLEAGSEWITCVYWVHKGARCSADCSELALEITPSLNQCLCPSVGEQASNCLLPWRFIVKIMNSKPYKFFLDASLTREVHTRQKTASRSSKSHLMHTIPSHQRLP